MAAFFVATSTQYLVNSAPFVLDYPFTVGMWAKLTAVGNATRTLFCLSDTATTNNYLLVSMSTAETVGVIAAAGGTDDASYVATSMVTSAWHFIVARFISSTNRKISFLARDGSISVATTATARAPAGMDTATIGAKNTSGGISDLWNGRIGEFWLANADIQADGAELQAALFRRLAYGGPFSVPSLAKSLVEYRSFRVNPTKADNGSEVWYNTSVPVWTNTNGVTTGPHPPLPYWYVKPGQVKTQLVF